VISVVDKATQGSKNVVGPVLNEGIESSICKVKVCIILGVQNYVSSK